MGMWFFFLAGIFPNANVVMPFAGLIVIQSQISDYLHWISPIAWALKALAINQYRSSEFDVCVYDVVSIGVPVKTVVPEGEGRRHRGCRSTG
ncbi:hypothetical protein PI124_g22005 [Phytophthora idaei]|nr:hypothetical protein PI125_g26117 [Phytophthora idaei]KAG3123787.1 hypothetical protein PI126_g23547 [Phytophthora idaei]KAG3232913.1 hypothetical protein PI124_g22005 [Phytophthora idaei]